MTTKQFVSLIVVSFSASAYASDRAVEAVHYEVGAEADYTKTEGNSGYSSYDSKSIGGSLGGELTLPLGPFLGGSVTVGYDATSTKLDSSSTKYEDGTVSGAAQLFYRHPSVGRISFGYLVDRTHSTTTYNSGSSLSDSSTDKSYLALAEGYLGPVTIGARDQRVFFDYGSSLTNHVDLLFAYANWYVNPQVRVGLRAGLEDARDLYYADIEFQPGFMRNVAGLYVDYVHGNQSPFTSNGVVLGVRVYFNKRFDLITRDRHYR